MSNEIIILVIFFLFIVLYEILLQLLNALIIMHITYIQNIQINKNLNDKIIIIITIMKIIIRL